VYSKTLKEGDRIKGRICLF